jgi:hypothetical protein
VILFLFVLLLLENFNFDRKKKKTIEDNVIFSYIYIFFCLRYFEKKNNLLIKMSLDTQKLDPNQRQQIMASVQQQLAIQNAQELLQVIY